MAGFWQGIAQHVQEKNVEKARTREQESQQKFQRELTKEDREYRSSESEKDRAARIRENAAGRSHDIDMFRRKTEAQQELIIKQLKIDRAARDAATTDYTGAVTRVEKMIEGADSEEAEKYRETLRNNPEFAVVIGTTVDDLQEKKGRDLTPNEIVRGIIPIITKDGPSTIVTPDGFSEEEDLMFRQKVEDNRQKAKQEPLLSVEGELFRNWETSEIERAESAVTNEIIKSVTQELEALKAGTANPQSRMAASELGRIRKGLLEGDEAIMMEAANMFGEEAVAMSILNNIEQRPNLGAIAESPIFGDVYFALRDVGQSTVEDVTVEETPPTEVTSSDEKVTESFTAEEIRDVYSKMSDDNPLKKEFEKEFKDILNESDEQPDEQPRNRRSQRRSNRTK